MIMRNRLSTVLAALEVIISLHTTNSLGMPSETGLLLVDYNLEGLYECLGYY